MTRSLLYGLLLGDACMFWHNSYRVKTVLSELSQERLAILTDPEESLSNLCQSPPASRLQVFWRENRQWISVCRSSKSLGQLPRHYRMIATVNYRVLFLAELPITFAIDIQR